MQTSKGFSFSNRLDIDIYLLEYHNEIIIDTAISKECTSLFWCFTFNIEKASKKSQANF